MKFWQYHTSEAVPRLPRDLSGERGFVVGLFAHCDRVLLMQRRRMQKTSSRTRLLGWILPVYFLFLDSFRLSLTTLPRRIEQLVEPPTRHLPFLLDFRCGHTIASLDRIVQIFEQHRHSLQ